MELVVQVWCPMEESPHDRALYVWACSRGVCQGLAGRCVVMPSRPSQSDRQYSVRAYRGLRFNEKYAAKLEKKKARQVKQAKPVEEVKPQAAKSNPFSVRRNYDLIHRANLPKARWWLRFST